MESTTLYFPRVVIYVWERVWKDRVPGNGVGREWWRKGFQFWSKENIKEIEGKMENEWEFYEEKGKLDLQTKDRKNMYN